MPRSHPKSVHHLTRFLQKKKHSTYVAVRSATRRLQKLNHLFTAGVTLTVVFATAIVGFTWATSRTVVPAGSAPIALVPSSVGLGKGVPACASSQITDTCANNGTATISFSYDVTNANDYANQGGDWCSYSYATGNFLPGGSTGDVGCVFSNNYAGLAPNTTYNYNIYGVYCDSSYCPAYTISPGPANTWPYNSNMSGSITTPNCSPLSPPQNPTSISASCSSDGTFATISWPASRNATEYQVATDPTNGTSCPSGWIFWTDPNNSASHACYADLTGTSIVFPDTSGTYYGTWVSAYSPTGGWNWVSDPMTSFSCPSGPPSGSITAVACTTATASGTCTVTSSWTSQNTSYYGTGPKTQVNLIDNATGKPYGGGWVPGTNYFPAGASGLSSSVLPVGSYNFDLYGWSAMINNWVVLGQTQASVGQFYGKGCVLPADGSGCPISATWTIPGLPAGRHVDLVITNPDSTKTSFTNLLPDPSQSDTVKVAGTYALTLLDHTTHAVLGTAPPIVACAPGYTLDTSTTPESCVQSQPSSGVPTCTTFSTTPNTITQGQSVTVNWSCQNVTSCTAVPNGDGFSTGGSPSGIDKTVTPSNTGQVTYGVVCSGKNFYSNPITVNSGNVTISASPTRVAYNGSTAVTATATNVDSCTITRNGQPWQTFKGNPSGTVTTQPPYTDSNLTSDTTYTVSCTGGANASAAANVTVTVVPQYAPF